MDTYNDHLNECLKLHSNCHHGPADALKTIVLWIYNINQNGAANAFHEDMSRFFEKDNDGNVSVRNMEPDMLAEFITHISTAKEIKMPELGVRIILLIYNCNQNGVANEAKSISENNHEKEYC